MLRTIITGHFGSGKTEIAMQMAQDRAALGCKATLIDLDIVNPYFTSSAHSAALTAMGIRIVSPAFANTNAEAPFLTGGVYAALAEKSADVIVDLGGDAAGATVMGSLAEAMQRSGRYDFLLAVNVFRPFTQNKADICHLMEELEAYARMRITGLINNANLLDETTPGHLLKGEHILEEVTALTGRPILFYCGTGQILEKCGGKLSGQPVALHPRNSPIWLRNGAIPY